MDPHSARLSRQAGVINQEKLSKARVSLIGGGDIADFALLTLSGLGVGYVEHVPGVHGFLGNVAGTDYPGFMERLNFEMEYVRAPVPTNEIILKADEYPTRSHIEAGVIAGLLGKNVVDRCEGNTPSRGKYLEARGKPGKYQALLVGAGATGTFVGLQATLSGFSLDIADGDEIAVHNLNRQVLYYDAKGNKAEVLARRLRKFGCEARAFPKMVDEEAIVKGYDIIFSCVDRYAPRRLLSRASKKYKIPLIDGGTGVHTGRVMSADENRTLEEQITLSREDHESKPGCVLQHNPSIIMPNMIVGSYMVDEALAILAGDAPRTIWYDAHRNEVYDG